MVRCQKFQGIINIAILRLYVITPFKQNYKLVIPKYSLVTKINKPINRQEHKGLRLNAQVFGPSGVIQLAQLLCCDWLLETRTLLWERDNGEFPTRVVDTASLSSFKQILNCLRRISQHIPGTLQRVCLYEAVYRLMAGAAPCRTQQLLDHSLRQRSNRISIICGTKESQDNAGEREHASALYMACRHLPPSLLSLPGERVCMLTEAVKSFEKIGAQKHLNECYELMKFLRCSTSVVE